MTNPDTKMKMEIMVKCDQISDIAVRLDVSITITKSNIFLALLSEHNLQMTNFRYFCYFHHKIGFDISCKLSPKTSYMKCQVLGCGKKNENISKYYLLNFSAMY